MRFSTPCLLLLLCAAPAMATEAAMDVQLRAEPKAIFIERTIHGQALNFELVLDNRSAVAVDIDRVQVSVFDDKDQLLLRRFIDGNGVRPSLQTLGERNIPAGKVLTVFNPFENFSTELAIARLHYDIELSNADGSQSLTRQVDVRPTHYRNHVSLRLPLAGRMINYDGHDALGHHRRFDVHFEPIAAMGFTHNFMRYSYDFAPVDSKGEMFAGDIKRNEDWFGFGADIHAVADGIVVAAVGDQPDNRRFDQSALATNPMVLFGNHVVIDHGGGEFGVYAHAQQGSVAVKPGQRVRQGDVIAKIGASGSAFFPHLHFQLQAGPDVHAEGLPSYFDGYSRVLGDQRIARKQASVDTGEIVETYP